jgi:HSP20 family protein
MRALIRRYVPRPMVWDPLAEFERLTNDFWNDWEFPTTYARLPYADMTEEDGSLVVKAELPGVGPEEIDVALKDGVLTIKAEHTEGEEAEGNGYHSVRYYRSITLPAHIDSEKVTATMENGLLEVRVPKTEAIEAKRVEVKALKEPKPKKKGIKRAKNAKKEAEGKK